MASKILILGSTGRTGKLLLQEALKQGYTVNVLVRDSSKIELLPNLAIYEGSPANFLDLQKASDDCEAILSTLNISRQSDFPWASLKTPSNFLSQTMQHIVNLGIQRVIFTSAWGVSETKNDIPRWFKWLIDNSNIGVAYRDHETQEAILEKSKLAYTSVRPVGLTNTLKKQNIRVTLKHNTPKPTLTISRQSVAHFMLDCLKNQTYIRQKPIISAES